jgi:hypothetical protein
MLSVNFQDCRTTFNMSSKPLCAFEFMLKKGDTLEWVITIPDALPPTKLSAVSWVSLLLPREFRCNLPSQ